MIHDGLSVIEKLVRGYRSVTVDVDPGRRGMAQDGFKPA
jgi:hypothetical protein